MAKKPAETPSIGLGAMLKQDIFQVPSHQRDYSWTTDEINQLFDDVVGAMDRDPQYFLGLMVCISRDDGSLLVLDGQQRLATTIIFLSAVRAWLQQFDAYKEDAQQIRDDFIGRRELGETDIRPKMNLNSVNNLFFQKFVVNVTSSTEVEKQIKQLKKHDRNFNLLNAIMVCRKWVAHISEEAPTTEDSAKRLIQLVKYITEDVRVVRFIVEDDAAAYTVFETLNDRGIDLTTIDLVKNHLFGRLPPGNQARLDELEGRWTQMMGTLANVKANDFLKAYWTSRHGRTQKDRLFQNLKRAHNTADSATDLSIELASAAEQYAALQTSDDAIWSQYSPLVRETIATLKTLGAAQTHPIILSALEKFAPGEFERLLRLLEVIIVRYQLVGGQRTGRLEISCARAAKEIYDGAIRTATQAKDALRDVYLSDDDFETAFRDKEEKNSEKAKYLLKKLEIEEQRLISPGGYRTIEPGGAITLEHVLPKNPGDDWADVLAKDRSIVEDCAYMLGNLCLLGKTNREIGRSSFEVKKKVYADSQILITRQLAEYEKWDRSEIQRRQAVMAKRARNVWRFQ